MAEFCQAHICLPHTSFLRSNCQARKVVILSWKLVNYKNTEGTCLSKLQNTWVFFSKKSARTKLVNSTQRTYTYLSKNDASKELFQIQKLLACCYVVVRFTLFSENILYLAIFSDKVVRRQAHFRLVYKDNVLSIMYSFPIRNTWSAFMSHPIFYPSSV